ncbi:MAG: GIY-YIG nuclease family protein [Chloroflexi bacterium]|nr:GIY-YIG nuclease family protein [Chloroflexota bacterium]
MVNPGSYIIIAEMKEPAEIRVRSGRTFSLETGFYAYVGSALNGLEARVARHLGKEKKLHWHIDFLLERAAVRGVIVVETTEEIECSLARALARSLPSIKGFGCSDCRCPSHLFFCDRNPVLDIRRYHRRLRL